jgi:hypothetical protein
MIDAFRKPCERPPLDHHGRLLTAHTAEDRWTSQLSIAVLHYLLIESYLKLSGKRSNDYSDVWCPDVGSARGYREAISAVVRTAARCFTLVSTNVGKFRAADALLRAHDSLIFNRIRWYVYGRSPEVARAAIIKDLFHFIPVFRSRLYPSEFADMISRTIVWSRDGSCAGHRTRGHCALSAMLTVSQLSKSFAGRALFDYVSLQVNCGDRIKFQS